MMTVFLEVEILPYIFAVMSSEKSQYDAFSFNAFNYKLSHRLEKARQELTSKDTALQEMTLEVERTRALELKAFQGKEEMRSKLEEMYEERVKMEKVCYK